MLPIDIKTIQQRGKMASKRRHHVRGKLIFVGLFILVLLVGIGYLLFYSPWLRVNTVAFEGLNSQHQEEVRRIIDTTLDRKVLGLPVGRDILFVRAGSLEAAMAEQLPFLKGVNIQKKYFHTLKVVGSERQAEGVWCFQDDCRYFDRAGILWGQAIKSSGFLLLNIDDMRTASSSAAKADQQFLEAIQKVVPGLDEQDIKIKKIVIPSGSFTEFDAVVSDGYPVRFSLDSDLPAQIKVYQIFRNQKLGSGPFHPEYVDVRFDGRVYYK